ncbi:50S ribosomal protein L30 [Thermogladius sp. 4427co]|uniref:50S ribosomal protein L30 n=1 Tax=Thermogladius sp. 4427co TaxID=3450718 RepID=UPI003F7A2286
MPELYAIIRLRGIPDTPPDVEYTLNLLRLRRKFNLVIYPKDLPGLEGMLKKVKDWVTWGEIDLETLALLLEKRSRAVGNVKLDNDLLKKYFNVNSFRELAEKIMSGEVILHKQELIKPVFRLHPPRGGFKGSIKRPVGDHGELGYRGKAINDLIKRML